MKERANKPMEELVDKLMNQSTLETPTLDFTSLVMEEVTKVKLNTHTTYEPLISKRTWFALCCVFIGFVGYILWIGTPENSGVFEINVDFLSGIHVSALFKGIHMSSITRNSILIFSLLFLIQIPLLKHYFDKRILN